MIAFCNINFLQIGIMIIVYTAKDFQLKEFLTQAYPPKVLSKTILVLQQ